jgi:ABC-type antimicrobial peptide transport system permease subunit
VISYNVTRRRNEIGIRIALGAAAGQVQRMVLGEVGRLVSVGIVLGVIASYLTTRLLGAFLFGVDARDPLTLGLSVLVLVAVAIAAGALPARRAARLDPMLALREE